MKQKTNSNSGRKTNKAKLSLQLKKLAVLATRVMSLNYQHELFATNDQPVNNHTPDWRLRLK